MPQPTSDVPSEPEGLVIEAVEWLPSGAEGGLIRVRGTWNPAHPPPAGQPGAPHPDGLPALCARRGEEIMRWDSLPDSRTESEGGVWRGAYLVPAALLDDAPDALWLEWSGNVRATIAPPRREAPASEASEADAAEVGGEVIDRAVLAERRARRAEAAEKEQARKATTALQALEALELRAGELERRLAEATAERDELASRVGVETGGEAGRARPGGSGLAAPGEAGQHAPDEAGPTGSGEAAPVEPAAPPGPSLADLRSDLDEARAARERAEARADRQRQALTGALTSAARARAQARDWRLRLRTSEVARASDAVRLAVIESEQDLRLELKAERRHSRQRAEALEAARAAAANAATEHERAGAELERRLAEEGDAHTQTRRRVDELVDELGETRAELHRVQVALGPARTEAARVPGLEARVDELERALTTASADLEAARAEADMIGSRLSAQSVARAALETELERERTMRAGLAAELEQERRRREESSEAELQRDLGLARADLATVRSDVDEARADRDAARAQIAGMRSQLDAAASRMDGFQAQLEVARSERDRLEAQLRAAEAERDGFRTELEAARATQERSGADVAAARAEQERLRTELQAEQERAKALADLEAEHARAQAELEAQRERIESEHAQARADLQAERDRIDAEHAQARADLQAERDRIEAERDRIVAERDRAEAERSRALAELEAEHERRRGEVEAEHDRQRAELEAQRERVEAEHARARAELQAERDRLRKGLEVAHSERDRAQVELAAARAQRDGFRAELEAARAARDRAQAELSAARQREASRLLTSPTFPERAAAETDPAALRERARLQAEAAARTAAQPAPATERMVADLDAAAATLRHDVGDPLLHPERAIPEPQPEEPDADKEEAPSGWLRHALARLAVDDPRGAGELIAGLLPAQGPAIGGPVDYDLTIREIGTFAVMVWSRRARIQRLTGPRSRREAAFHVEADAHSLAELLAGIARIRRFRGDARISGKRRRAKILNALPTCGLSLADAVRAGATLEPGPLFRALRYAIDPAWTVGHSFTVAQRILDLDSETWYISVRDGKPLAITDVAPLSGVDASVTMSSDTYYAMLRGDALPPGERPNVRGDYGAVALLKAWTDRAQAADSEN